MGAPHVRNRVVAKCQFANQKLDSGPPSRSTRANRTDFCAVESITKQCGGSDEARNLIVLQWQNLGVSRDRRISASTAQDGADCCTKAAYQAALVLNASGYFSNASPLQDGWPHWHITSTDPLNASQ
jgi:hypothetical protein